LAAAITISLSVLAMHQLAVNHSFAAPATSGSHVTQHRPLAVETQQYTLTVLSTGDYGSSPTLHSAGADPCWPDCGADHEISVLSCVLALTLLVLPWLLSPPRECRPRVPVALRLPAVTQANYRKRAPSLAELSVLRT
jgi:hypothetical protein